MEVYNHMDKIRYERVGPFLVSKRKILGPRIRIEKPKNDSESEFYRTIVKYIREQKYKELESFLGIELGLTEVKISKDKVEINYRRTRKMNKHILRYYELEIEFEPFDKYYAFLPKATLVINTDSPPTDYDSIHYYQNNISGEFTIEKLPPEIGKAVLTGEIYDRFFEPLGISEDANISMEHISWQNVISLRIVGQAGGKEVDTYAVIDLSRKPLTIRFIGWPFAEGVYAFNVKLGEKVNLGERSISVVRKKLIKPSKKYGPPHGIRIPRDWKIAYSHLHYIKYTRGKYSITFYQNNNVEIQVGSRVIKADKWQLYHLLEDLFEAPEFADLF